MEELIGLVPNLALAMVVGYLLGALPLADQISRRHGVDIFAVGTGLAGASNVRRNVGSVPFVIVLLGDLAKGSAAVIFAELVGVEGPWLILPVVFAVSGHWRSVFSGFRGGDGLATLGGAAIALFPSFGLISAAVAMAVGLGGQKMPYSSLVSVVLGYATLVWLTVTFDEQTTLAFGFGGVAALVLAYALNGHRLRRHGSEWGDEVEANAEQTRVGP